MVSKKLIKIITSEFWKSLKRSSNFFLHFLAHIVYICKLSLYYCKWSIFLQGQV